MAEKVTDLNKIVTDPVMLSALSKQGIDKDYVEFVQDYAPRSLGKRHSPYAKFYRDLKSGKKFMVVSGLPMVKPDGTKIEAGWSKQGNKYVSKANLFSAVVDGGQVTLTCLSDQPSGTKKDAQVIWSPQLFLDGKEQRCDKAVLLDTDPTNPNYHQNTLEWDYGICKRRIRIIEGRFREKWIFESNPNGEVRIKHNISGNLPLKLGRGLDAEDNPVKVWVEGDSEVVSEFGNIYPVEIGASPETFYPDAHIETSSVDGFITRAADSSTWASLHGDTDGTTANDDGDDLWAYLLASPTTNRWQELAKSPILLDTSGLPNGASISDAILSIYGQATDNTLGTSPTFNIYSSTPNSNTALVVGDYNQFGTTAYATAIAYADLNTGDPGTSNDWTLNATGHAAISKIGVSKFALREATYDAANSEPSWSNFNRHYFRGWSSDKGAGYKPKLVVTYTVNYPISLSPGLTASVSIDRDVAWDRATQPGLTVSATIARALAYHRATTPGLTVAVTIVKVFGRLITTSTALAISTTVDRVLAYGRATSPGLTAAVSIVRSFPRTIAISANMVISTTIARAVAWDRATQPALSVAVSVVRKIAKNITTSTGLTASVTIAKTVAWNRVLQPALSTSVSIVRTVAWDRTIQPALSVAVSIVMYWVCSWINLTLRSRSLNLTLKGRSLSLTLEPRSLSLTLRGRE